MEFLLAAVPVLLLGLGSIEAIYWHFTRQAVSLALAQAARAAITRHADPAALDHAFAEALLPLHAAPSPAQSRARLQRAIDRRMRATGLPAWRLRILSPSVASFRDFASPDPELRHLGPPPVIDNDYLHEQHQLRLAQGWPGGRGPASGQTTLEANTLVLRLTWLHEPLLPGVRNLLRQLAPSDARYGSLAMARGGYLPLHREVAFVMQSHAVAWDMPGHGRVLRLAGGDANDEDGIKGPGAGGNPPPAGGGQSEGNHPAPWSGSESTQQGHGEAHGRQGATETDAGGAPWAQAGAAAPCTGLWCLAPAAFTDRFAGPRTGTEAAPGGGLPPAPDAALMDTTMPETAAADAAEPGAAQREAGLDGAGRDPPPLPAEPDDCPGCCA